MKQATCTATIALLLGLGFADAREWDPMQAYAYATAAEELAAAGELVTLDSVTMAAESGLDETTEGEDRIAEIFELLS